MLDFNHILESSFGLTCGGLLLKIIDKLCRNSCQQIEVQNVASSTPDDSNSSEQNEDISDISDITDIPHYDNNTNIEQ